MSASTSLLPEDRLLLLLARRDLTEADRDRTRSLLGPSLAWGRLLEQAEGHGVVPLVRRNLDRLGADVPSAVRNELDRACRAIAVQNALLARELVRVLRRLDDAGVPVAPVKGVALAESLYGDITLRVCSDIDVLVPRQMVARAFRLLLADGYRAEFTERFFATLLLRTDIEFTLVRLEHGVEYALDLHWGIGWSPRTDRGAAEDLWADSRRVTRCGVEVHAMSPEWELLFLAVHAARHRWQALKWLVDIHEMCLTRQIEWQKLRGKAERFGWLPALEHTLGVCHAFLDTPVPPGIVPTGPRPWLARFPGEPASAWAEALFPLRLLGRPSEKLRFLLRLLLAPTLAERRLVRLPLPLRLLYYPLRPVRLSAKWGWRFMRGTRSDSEYMPVTHGMSSGGGST